jgi:hypothetical protein
VVDPATVPTTPIGPNRMLFSSLVLLVGFGAGAALALLLVQLDRSFFTLHDLRKLGLPVLGGISAADPPPRGAFAAVVFSFGLLLLVATYGAVLAGGPMLMALAARVPGFLARVIA